MQVCLHLFSSFSKFSTFLSNSPVLKLFLFVDSNSRKLGILELCEIIDLDWKEFRLFFDAHLGNCFDFLEGTEICERFWPLFKLLLTYPVFVQMGFLAEFTVLLFFTALLPTFFRLFSLPCLFLVADSSVCFLLEFLKVYSSSIWMCSSCWSYLWWRWDFLLHSSCEPELSIKLIFSICLFSSSHSDTLRLCILFSK